MVALMVSSHCADSLVDKDDMEINLSCRDCPETSVDTIHSPNHRDSEFELQTEFTLECMEKERKWGEG